MAYALESLEEARRLRQQQNISAYSIEDEFGSFVIKKGSTVLDAGCGEGAVSRFLSQRHSTVNFDARDFSEIRVQQAKTDNQEERINFDVANLESINADNNYYDAIVSRYVFEHLRDPSVVAKELYRVTKSGGSACICDFDNLFIGLYTKDQAFNAKLESLEHRVGVDLTIGRKIPAILSQAGFAIDHVEVTAHCLTGMDLELEADNYRQRFSQMNTTFVEIFGSQEKANDFFDEYINLMMEPSSVYFMNKFVVTASKL